MSSQMIVLGIVFAMVVSGFLMIYMVMSGRRAKLDARLRDLAADGTSAGLSNRTNGLPDPVTMAEFARTALPRMGSSLVPTNEAERTLLKSRLIFAGYYSQQAMPIYFGLKMLFMIAPTLVGLVLGAAGVLPLRYALLGGACLSILGMIGPSLWLDKKKNKRQSKLRRGLPDALDLLVICLEGGLSLQAALRRISIELNSAHMELAFELSIVQREIQLGRSPGEALQEMSKRTDMEEMHNLSTVISQSERFGASLVKSLRVHADIMRLKRQQNAEEMGQKASTKVLFPTLLFIFPAMFVVILGPAAIQIARTFGSIE